MVGSLIDETLREINRNYKPGLLPWLKRKPEQWGKIQELEARINQTALKQDKNGLTVALEAYKRFFPEALSVCGQGNLFGDK
jgi:hypothetical protein